MDKKPKVIFAPKKVERGAKQGDQISKPATTTNNNEQSQGKPKAPLRNKGLSFDFQQYQAKSLYSSLQQNVNGQNMVNSTNFAKNEQIEDDNAPIDLNAPLPPNMKRFGSESEIISSSTAFNPIGQQQIGEDLGCCLVQFPGILPFQNTLDRMTTRDGSQFDAAGHGPIGRLIRYKSGKTELELGGIRYTVFESPQSAQVITVNACDHKHGIIQPLAHVDKLLVCAVDFNETQDFDQA